MKEMAAISHATLSLCARCARGRIVRQASSLSNLPWRKEAEKIVGYPTSFLNLKYLLSDEVSNVVGHLRKLVGTKHPLLKTARKLLDDEGGFQCRGITVLLMSKALANASFLDPSSCISTNPSGILPAQRHLSEITELIYTSEVIHDNVVDLGKQDGTSLEQLTPEEVRGLSDGNKLAVLMGDYLLANASAGLGKLYNVEVTRMMSQALSDMKVASCLRVSWLMEEGADRFDLSEDLFSSQSGHISSPPAGCETVGQATRPLQNWLRWSGLAHGSLLAHGCSGTAELAGMAEDIQQSAWRFGWHLAQADGLYSELQSSASLLSSPLSAGFLRTLCNDKATFEKAQTEAKCAQQYHAEAAVEALAKFPPSDTLDALVRMAKELT